MYHLWAADCMVATLLGLTKEQMTVSAVRVNKLESWPGPGSISAAEENEDTHS